MSAHGVADVCFVVPIGVVRSAASPAATRLVQCLKEGLEPHEERIRFPGGHVSENVLKRER